MEYLQQLLKVPVNGKFDDPTHKAVLAFQASHNCQVDGVVGNQTWAALRHETPEAVGTDGRPAHTFEEHGAEARFFLEDKTVPYNKSDDSVTLKVESVGDEVDISKHKATVKVTPANATSGKVVEIEIGAPVSKSPTGQGNLHNVVIRKFKEFLTDPQGDPNGSKIDAYLDAELGGDTWNGTVGDPPPPPPPPNRGGGGGGKRDPQPKVLPVDPPKRPSGVTLEDIIRDIISIARQLADELNAIKALAGSLADIPLLCKLPLAGLIAALTVAVGAVVAAIPAAAAPPVEAGVIVVAVGSVAGAIVALLALIDCLESHADEATKPVIAQLRGHLQRLQALKASFEKLIGDARKFSDGQ